MNKRVIFGFLLIAFPFVALFGTPIRLFFVSVRPTELLCYAFAPFVLYDYFSHSSRISRVLAFTMLGGLLGLQCVYATGFLGLINRSGMAGVAYLRMQLFPVYLVLLVLMLRYWMLRTAIGKSCVIQWTVVFTCMSGLLGWYAMGNDNLREILTRNYSQFLTDIDQTTSANQRFDMTVRAMSVFKGYDQASVQYAAGLVMAVLLIGINVSRGKRMLLIVANSIMIASLVVCIISSARTGIVVCAASLATLFLVGRVFSMRAKVYCVAIGIATYFGGTALVDVVFPRTATLERYSDIISFLEGGGSPDILSSSRGLTDVYDTQYKGIAYPDGINVFLGLGDNGEFISDAGWVNHYVRFGLVGVCVAGGVFAGFVVYAMRVRYRIYAARLRTANGIFALSLPAFAVLYALAAAKGPFYFLTNISAEIFAIILATALLEGEALGGKPQVGMDRFANHVIDRRVAKRVTASATQ